MMAIKSAVGPLAVGPLLIGLHVKAADRVVVQICVISVGHGFRPNYTPVNHNGFSLEARTFDYRGLSVANLQLRYGLSSIRELRVQSKSRCLRCWPS